MKQMRTSGVLLGCSAGLNLFIIGVLLLKGHNSALNPADKTIAQRSHELNERVAVPVGGGTNAFRWNQLESPDYPVYIANLRSIGCPEETIKDIVLAELNKLYASKYSVLMRTLPQNYWEPPASHSTELAQQQTELFQEHRTLVKELLGIDIQSENRKNDPALSASQRRFDFLPETDRQRVCAWQDKYSDLERQIYANSKGLLTSEDQAALATLRQQKEAELVNLLTPAARLEFDLRTSPAAERLRTQLSQIQPSEQEFRAIYQAQVALDAKLDASSKASPQDPTSGEPEVTARREFVEQMRQILGDTRYAEYQRAQTPEYQTLARVARRFSLPPEVAGQALDIEENVEFQTQATAADSRFTEEERQTAKERLRAQALASLSSLLGPQALSAYCEHAAGWLGQLGK